MLGLPEEATIFRLGGISYCRPFAGQTLPPGFSFYQADRTHLPTGQVDRIKLGLRQGIGLYELLHHWNAQHPGIWHYKAL